MATTEARRDAMPPALPDAQCVAVAIWAQQHGR